MRIRRVIDNAFEQSGVTVRPQVETDSVASLYAHVGVGEWASIVPHTWLRAMPVTGTTRPVRLVEPDARAQISVAIHSATPGSVTARAFMTAARGLSRMTSLRSPCGPHRSSAENGAAASARELFLNGPPVESTLGGVRQGRDDYQAGGYLERR